MELLRLPILSRIFALFEAPTVFRGAFQLIESEKLFEYSLVLSYSLTQYFYEDEKTKSDKSGKKNKVKVGFLPLH